MNIPRVLNHEKLLAIADIKYKFNKGDDPANENNVIVDNIMLDCTKKGPIQNIKSVVKLATQY